MEIVSNFELTPEIAEGFLKLNHCNRKVKPVHVERLVHAIKSGQWEYNGESIKLNADGYLVDGQHRCLAVVESGTAITTVLIKGVPDKSVLDEGVRRGLSDILSMRGEKNSPMLAAALRIVWLWEEGHILYDKGKSAASNGDLLKCLDRHPDLRVVVLETSNEPMSRTLGKMSVLAAFKYIFSKTGELGEKFSESFFEKLYSGVGLEKGNPILLLRERVISDRHSHRIIPTKFYMAWIIKAWNLWLMDETRSSLSWKPRVEPFPEILSPDDL